MVKIEKSNRSVLSDAGYRTFAEILPQSEKLWALPPSLVLSRIDEGDGLLAAFVKYSVKWHKSCHNKFSSRELQRKIAAFETACLSTLDSSELGESSDDVPSKRRCTRADLDSGIPSAGSHKQFDVCFFCDQPLGDQSGQCRNFWC